MNKFFEAREFLTKAKTDLAKNRFPSKKESVDFVEHLYTLGASQIFVTGIGSYVSDDDMSCDELVVHLPADKEKRKAIFDIYNKELVAEGLEAEKDEDQKEIKFWWD